MLAGSNGPKEPAKVPWCQRLKGSYRNSTCVTPIRLFTWNPGMQRVTLGLGSHPVYVLALFLAVDFFKIKYYSLGSFFKPI